MRVVVCPDSFGDTLDAVSAARAMREGWLREHPEDEVLLVPLSDGGPGFVQAMATSTGADLHTVPVRGPLGREVTAVFAMRGTDAWIESAQACGLHLVEPHERDPQVTTTYGVGQLVAAAISVGATRITIGLGGSATNDGGAGMLAALGAHSSTGPLDAGGAALKGIAHVNLLPAIDAVQGVELIAATDVDNPLLGIRGASATYGPQKGADQAMVVALDAALEHFAAACGRTAAGKDPAVALGSGAAGGLGYGLMRIGARREPGIATVLDAVGLVPCLREADLVITGEGKLDDQSLHGKVVIGVAQAAASVGCACIAVAGQVRLGKRELGGAGIDAAYSVSDFVGLDFSLSEPHEAVAQATARVARTWGRR